MQGVKIGLFCISHHPNLSNRMEMRSSSRLMSDSSPSSFPAPYEVSLHPSVGWPDRRVLAPPHHHENRFPGNLLKFLPIIGGSRGGMEMGATRDGKRLSAPQPDPAGLSLQLPQSLWCWVTHARQSPRWSLSPLLCLTHTPILRHTPPSTHL